MRDAVRPVLRRLAAYAIDFAILAAVLIPIAFGTQALVGYRPDTGMFALSPQLGTFSGFQVSLLWVVYGLFAVYLFVALRNGGRRTVHDLIAGSAVTPAPA